MTTNKTDRRPKAATDEPGGKETETVGGFEGNRYEEREFNCPYQKTFLHRI